MMSRVKLQQGRCNTISFPARTKRYIFLVPTDLFSAPFREKNLPVVRVQSIDFESIVRSGEALTNFFLESFRDAT